MKTYISLEEGDIILVQRRRVLLVLYLIFWFRRHWNSLAFLCLASLSLSLLAFCFSPTKLLGFFFEKQIATFNYFTTLINYLCLLFIYILFSSFSFFLIEQTPWIIFGRKKKKEYFLFCLNQLKGPKREPILKPFPQPN